MANWCFNQVDIKGEESEISKVIELLKKAIADEEGNIEFFQRIQPMPAHLEKTVGENLDESLDEQGEPIHWYFWRHKHWGTKWDVDGISYESSDKNSLTIIFYTATNPALPVILTLSESVPNLNITHRFYELGRLLVGTANFRSGEVIEYKSNEANRQTMELHGFETDYFDAMESDGDEIKAIGVTVKDPANGEGDNHG